MTVKDVGGAMKRDGWMRRQWDQWLAPMLLGAMVALVLAPVAHLVWEWVRGWR